MIHCFGPGPFEDIVDPFVNLFDLQEASYLFSFTELSNANKGLLFFNFIDREECLKL